MSTKEAAALWGISDRQVSKLCGEGKVSGAVKKGRSWAIPIDTAKPADGRIKPISTIRQPDLPLPIGISDYRLASTEYYYIDKTMMIKDFLDERPMVSLFTRPRRFGKTLNMDMLRTFFEKTDKDTSVYFKDKKIWACGNKYREYQGKYPVIFLSFKDVKFNTWEETFDAIKDLFSKETSRHPELIGNEKLSASDKKRINSLVAGDWSAVELSGALATLSQALHEYHGIAPIIIIDEYDTPIQQGHVKGFYDDVVELSQADREQLGRAPFDMEEYKEFLDIDDVNGEAGYTTQERTGIRPCLDVNGIWGGFTGEGAKTVLPSKAHAKISMRLVPNQNCETIARLFEEHFMSIAPKGVRVKVTPHHGGNGFLIPISSPAYQAASRAIGEVYGIEPVPSRGGGSIPILADLQQILNVDPLLMGFGLERDTIHSPNESYLLSQFYKGMESIALFYRYF